ncbi:MAG: DUF1549 and DUF1553 domain-containing protein [Bryobacterales bacterium]|nr:DUF1549 and DUF1553 domain-containing protein [Bryobacterales bacterium]
MHIRLSVLVPITGMILALPIASGQPFSAESIRFFETEVRPTLQTRCAQCHNDTLRTSGFSVTSRENILTGGNRGEAVSLDRPAESLILSALRHSGPLKMPADGRLSTTRIDSFERWIELGAPWPEGFTPAAATPGDEHWSFQPIDRSELPEVSESNWVRNPIDRFVLARLDEAGLEPSPEADPATLMRRVHLDLTGLLPNPEEIRTFLADQRPGAYARLVERLLKSPHYGERWGRHWLDIARYADSNGYNNDAPRKIWRYRDWVIDAFNRDLPFDQFVIEQIAGDLLPNPSQDQLIATGFHRNTLLNLEGGVDFEQYRVEAVVDRVAVTGVAFLGLTLGCARCHDHKYDPISQREFYELFAFFNSIDELSGEFNNQQGRARAYEPLLEFGTAEQHERQTALRAQIAAMRAEQKKYEARLLENLPQWEASLTEDQIDQFPVGVQRILRTPPEQRLKGRLVFVKNEYLGQDIGVLERRKAIAAVTRLLPDIPSTLIMRDLPQPRPTHVLLQGEFLNKGIQVQPGTPRVLAPLGVAKPNRLDLARWLVDERNPLTPRVTVNRVWQRFFGRGIVRTENDFGTQGEAPTHPLLLDWLASEFITDGWSMKSLHRLIVTSATYRQASTFRPDLAATDESNRLLGRQNRLRVESEIVRDLALSASGLLEPAIGGPSVFPAQPPGVMIRNPWRESKGKDRYRRGMYTYFWRTSPHPGLMVFDSPDSLTIATRRNRSNTPLQALTLLNDTAFHEFSQGLATRILTEQAGQDRAEQISHAFRVCLTRSPSEFERNRLERFLSTQLDEFRTYPERIEQVLTLKTDTKTDLAETAAWTVLAGVLMNLDEFVTRE